MKLLVVCLMVVFFFSCSKKEGPHELLQDYITYRFSKDQTKENVMKFLGGNLAETIKDMDEEKFKKFTSLKGYKKKNFKIIHENCDESKCFITYLLGHDIFKKSEKEYSLEVKKTAELRLVDKKWKIFDVLAIKTHLDIHKELGQ